MGKVCTWHQAFERFEAFAAKLMSDAMWQRFATLPKEAIEHSLGCLYPRILTKHIRISNSNAITSRAATIIHVHQSLSSSPPKFTMTTSRKPTRTPKVTTQHKWSLWGHIGFARKIVALCFVLGACTVSKRTHRSSDGKLSA
eukprot:3591123-Amphidinium_carterae.1